MRLPTFRIIDLLEWVVALAVGLATFRACFAVQVWRYQWGWMKSAWARPVVMLAPTLFGIAIFEGLVLSVERARGRGPRPWGVGHRTWSMAAIYAVLKVAFAFAYNLLPRAHATGALPSSEILAIYFSYHVTSMFGADIACAMAAFLVTVRLAGLPVDPSPDARECSGRAFAAIVMIGSILLALIQIIFVI